MRDWTRMTTDEIEEGTGRAPAGAAMRGPRESACERCECAACAAEREATVRRLERLEALVARLDYSVGGALAVALEEDRLDALRRGAYAAALRYGFSAADAEEHAAEVVRRERRTR